MSAISGLDIALWFVSSLSSHTYTLDTYAMLDGRDIKGKTLGVPVWQLLGGKVRDRCKVYGWIGGDKPSDVLEQAKVRKEQGFTAVKMNATESVCPRPLLLLPPN